MSPGVKPELCLTLVQVMGMKEKVVSTFLGMLGRKVELGGQIIELAKLFRAETDEGVRGVIIPL